MIDTIVGEVQSVPGEDRCVLLLGYQDQMEKMFQNANPGLSRRFPMSSAFVFGTLLAHGVHITISSYNPLDNPEADPTLL